MASKAELETLFTTLGFSTDYIERTFKVYHHHYGYRYNTETLTTILLGLQTMDQTKMTLHDATKLSVGDKIDHRDKVGRFVLAKISEKNGTNLKIHYEGYDEKWDGWFDYSLELHRFAHPCSISSRHSHRLPELKMKIDINPSKHPGWKPAEIKRIDRNSGQIQVVYHEDGKQYLYWAHLDNTEEIAPFTLTTTTTFDMMTKEIESLSWKFTEIFKNDGIYCCFAVEIFGDVSYKERVKSDCDVYMDNNVWFYGKIKSMDAVAMALAEVYNVKIEIFEYNHDEKCLYIAFSYGEYEETVNLPVVMMGRMDGETYSVIDYPQRVHPLNSTESRAHGVSLRSIRIERNKESILGKRKLNVDGNDNMHMYIPASKRIKLSQDLEFKEEQLNTFDLEELNRLKDMMQNNLRLIERVEKELIDNSLKCIACMDRRKNVTFDGCNHCALCDQCEASLQSKLCPICQTPYSNARKISM